MILESLRRVFVKSIDDESYCVIDESPKLFAAFKPIFITNLHSFRLAFTGLSD
jgi:hypothetical protein